jgi:uncharacterized membrane protein
MTDAPIKNPDERLDLTIGRLLRYGLFLSAAIVVIGALVYLIKHGSEVPDYTDFKMAPASLRRPVNIIDQALHFTGHGVIQLGLLLLIATPVARVFFSVFAFFRQRDYLYTVITLIVLLILLFSLFLGKL